ncbi:sigma factor-like helix-turn-helix DNA-binding protein, partial [Streptomyces bohaiensis]
EQPRERRRQRQHRRRRAKNATTGRGGDRREPGAHPAPPASASGDAGRREPVGGLLPDDPSDADADTGTEADADARQDADTHAAPDATVTPVHAFDALYLRNAGPIGQQAYLLCGRRDTAARAVAHGFRLAWERWPQVAADRDPAGWVRAAAYEYALSPWHRFRPWARAPLALGAGREEQELLDALLGLPAGQRRAVVLRDALGLGPAEAAAEAECTTAAAEARVRSGRDALAAALPRLAAVAPERRGEVLGAMMEALTASQPVPPLPASRARLECERTSRRQVQAAVALVVVTVGATAAGLFTG